LSGIENRLLGPHSNDRGAVGQHYSGRAVAFEHINYFLETMLHTTRLAGFRDVDQEDRCIVAASVQMYEGAVGFREIPAARFQS
jgi:hypothetical protein